MPARGPDPLARLARPLPHPEADFAARVAWIRTGARLWVRHLAIAELLSPAGDKSVRVEALNRCHEFGSLISASHAEVIAASDGEWVAAVAYCGRFMEAMRRAVWFRCRVREPGAVIMDAAKRLAMAWDMPIADAQLLTALRDIWIAAQPYQQKRGRRGGKR